LGKPEPERIGAVTALNFVIAKVVYYPVISRASVNPVITTVSRDPIITCETVDDVIFSGAFQSVIVFFKWEFVYSNRAIRNKKPDCLKRP